MSAQVFFGDVLAKLNEFVPRSITILGVTKEIYVKRISAKERMELLPINKIQSGGAAEFSLQDIVAKNHKMVFFAIVDDAGKRVFQNADEVGKIPEALFVELLKHATDVNKEVEETGKA